MSDHPVSYAVEAPEGERNRLTVAFRLILAIPHLLLVGGPGDSGSGVGVGAGSGALGAVASICSVINWFAIVFTGRAIPGLIDLTRFYMRWRARVLPYAGLLRDEYPPFGDSDYPVSVELPATIENRNRWTVGFRIILAIPQLVVITVLLFAWFVTAVIGWFAVLFTGRYPDGLWRFGESVMRWSLRVEAYMLLLYDAYPPFSLENGGAAPVPAPAGPGA